jgi:hypothetical protein
MDFQVLLVARAFPFKAEFGAGFGARVYDAIAKQSTVAPAKFDSYEAARDWAKRKAHDMMAGRPYRLASIKQSKKNQNRFYDANLWGQA